MTIRVLLFMLDILISNIVQVVTGFAGTLLAMPPAIRLIGVTSAKASLNFLSLCSCIFVAWKSRADLDRKILLRILVVMGSGLAMGIWLTGTFPEKLLVRIYGIVILLIAFKRLFLHTSGSAPKPLQYLCLLLAGIMHGMFASGGAFLVVYASAALPKKDSFRATVSAVWVVLDTILVFSHLRSGYFTGQVCLLTVLGAVPLILALWAGSRIASRISPERFYKLVSVLLLISGLIAVL